MFRSYKEGNLFMVEIEKPRIECIDSPENGSYGKYVVEPLERGYGTTLGNSLRRILLSSLPGTAATSTKMCEYSEEHPITSSPSTTFAGRNSIASRVMVFLEDNRKIPHFPSDKL